MKQNKDSFLSARPSARYSCPVCGGEHDSRGLFAYRKGKDLLINCFKNRDNKNASELITVAVTSEKKCDQYQKMQAFYDSIPVAKYTCTTRVCNEKNITYELDS